jgi:hypothetical protein
MICHNYRIYYKNKICMHAPTHVHVVQWLGEVFYYLFELFTLFMWSIYAICAKKIEPQFMACVPHGGWDVGPRVWLTRGGEVWPGAHRRVMWVGTLVRSNQVVGWLAMASSTIWKHRASNTLYIYYKPGPMLHLYLHQVLGVYKRIPRSLGFSFDAPPRCTSGDDSWEALGSGGSRGTRRRLSKGRVRKMDLGPKQFKIYQTPNITQFKN